MRNKKQRIFLKSLLCDFLIFALQWGVVSPTYANSALEEKEIIRESQLSYRAEGGFTGVESFGVILSCVNGQVSVMKSINDPRLSPQQAHMREVGTMNIIKYLDLWKDLDRSAVLSMADAPLPKTDIRDEYTVHFYAKLGESFHQFDVNGITRPEVSRYFAIRKLIDDSVQMQALWATHQNTAKALGKTTVIGKAN